METPTPRNQPLFDLMAQDHGLTLTVSEMDDIEAIVARMLADDRCRESEHSAGPELGAALGSAAEGKRATIAELEAILDSTEPREIEIQPDGSITSVPAGTATNAEQRVITAKYAAAEYY